MTGVQTCALPICKRFIDVSGLAGPTVSKLRIVKAQSFISTHEADAIATFHQMALLGKGNSTLSCLQMEAFGADINDRSRLLPGGKQRIVIDGYQLPLDFTNGLPIFLVVNQQTMHSGTYLNHHDI